MYRPKAFGYISGYYLYYPDGSRFHFGELVPLGEGDKLKVKTSWLTQGRAVNNGHEVAHCKLAGGIRKHNPMLPAKFEYRSQLWESRSGTFVSQHGETTYVYFIDDKVSVMLYANASTSRVYVDCAVRFQGEVRTPTSGRYRQVRGRLTITKDGFVSLSNTNVPAAKRSEFAVMMSGFMSSVLDTSFTRTDSAYLESLAKAGFDYLYTNAAQYAPSTWTIVPIVPNVGLIEPSQEFVLDEPWTLLGGAMITLPFGAYHLKALMQEAYIGCLDSVPLMSDNNISNILEIVGLIKGLVVDHKIEVPKHIADAWMSYRYVYKTTEMDVKQTLSYIRRASHDLSKGFSCYGVASGKIRSDVTAMVRCRMDFKHKELSNLENLCEKLYTYGLTPNAYVIWDMIPYSFIVDWFIPIGNILQATDRDQRYNRTYDISNIWYSLTYTHQAEEGYDLHCYTRWSERDTPGINGFYTIETMSASNKVKGMRILDTLSMTLKR